MEFSEQPDKVIDLSSIDLSDGDRSDGDSFDGDSFDDRVIDVSSSRDLGVHNLGAPDLAAAIEALMIVADEPMSEETIAALTGSPVPEVEAEIVRLSQEYREQGRGFALRRTGGGWRFYTAEECSDLVARYVTDGQAARLSQAALETLAVIAYRQPVTRSRIGAVRGVNVDGVVRTLQLRGLIEQVGTEPETGAGLYATTSYFLERLGIDDISELPPLAEHVPIGEELDELVESHE